MFIKQKLCGRLKGRSCADGKEQRDKFTKEEEAGVTVVLESAHLTSVIDAKENRDAATLDLQNAFMQTTIGYECVITKLRGAISELMVRVALERHCDYVTHEMVNRFLT